MIQRSINLADVVRSGDLVMWGQACAAPLSLTRQLAEQAEEIGHFRCFAGLGIDDPLGPDPTACPGVTTVSYTGIGHRDQERTGRLEVFSGDYSALAAEIATGTLRVDVLLVQVTRRGPDGLHRLALAADYLVAALATARVVIAEINQDAPLILDAPTVPDERVLAWVEVSRPPLEVPGNRVVHGEVEQRIGSNVATLVEDGATLQMGLGKIPEAVLGHLADRRNLGIHSGTIGDAFVRLVASGAVTNTHKGRDTGVSVTGLVMGSHAAFDAVDQNPAYCLRPISYTHDPEVLRSLHRFVSINSAIEIDLTGQANCEVAGGRYVGGVGGAVDFLRGAQRSTGGVPILALPSTAGARSRIVAELSGPATISRSHAPIIVTEHGIADLRGLGMRARRERLLAVTDPTHVAELEASSPAPGTN